MDQLELMNQVEADFGVTLFAHRAGRALFGALRETHWHLVIATFRQDPVDENWFHINIGGQLHVPRYVMAREINALLRMHALGGPPFPLSASLVGDVEIAVYPDGRIEFSIFHTGDGGLSQQISDSLKQDIPAFETAFKKMKQTEDGYSHPRAKSAYRNPVAHASRALIHAIAFERETQGRLNAETFGIYSAFCTMVDFPYSEEMTADIAREFLDQQFQTPPEDVPQEIQDIFSEVQGALFEVPIWGTGRNVSPDAAVPILVEALSKLRRGQRAQLLLMSGMHNAWLFVSLAAIIGTISFARYLEIITSNMQPDSYEEQSRRMSGAFIELLGELTQ
jgi:hypothetical protein